ncbi:MAG: FtsX-like permease family protein [Pseudomonadota bacterium]
MQALISHRFFKRHRGQLTLALIGIASGIAVMTGVALLRGALLESLDAASSVLAGDDTISVRSEQGNLDITAFANLARQPGSPDWVPVLRFPVWIQDQRFEVVALDPLVSSPATSPLLGPNSVVADSIEVNGPPAAVIAVRTLDALGLDASDTIELMRQGQSYELAIAGVIDGDRSMDRRLLMDITQAQGLFGLRGQLTELWAPATASSWLEQHVPDSMVWQRASQRMESAAQLTAGMRANLTAMSLLALVTGLFVVYSVLNFLIVQRRHDFGMLRALGLSPTGLARLLMTETLTLAAFGGLLGLVIGTWLADQLLALIAQPVGDLYGQLPLIESAPTLGLYLALWGLGLLSAAAVTLPLLAEARRVPPGRLVRAVQRPGLSLRRAAGLAIAPILAGVLLMRLDPGLVAALMGLFLVLSGIVLLIPALGFGLLARLSAHLPLNLSGRSLRLLQSTRARLAPALAALTLALALAMGMAMMILGFRVALDDWVARLLQADVYVSVQSSTQPHDAAPILDDAMISELIGQPGVEQWSSIRQRRLPDGRLLSSYDLPDQAWRGFDWIEGTPDRNRFVAGEAVFVTEAFARNRAIRPGHTIELTTPMGVKRLMVSAVFRDYSSDQGVIAIHGSAYRAWFDDGIRDSVGLYLAQNVDTEQWIERFSATPESVWFSWITPNEIRVQSLKVFDRTFRISWALAILVGLIALVALTSALLALGLERAREYATLRALGLSPNGLIGLVMIQTVGLTSLALLLAVPIAVLMDVVLSRIIQPRAFGWSVPLDWPPLEPIAWTLPLALLTGLLAGAYPALRIVRRPLIQHLRVD